MTPSPSGRRQWALLAARSVLTLLCVVGDVLAGVFVLAGPGALGWLLHLIMVTAWASVWHANGSAAQATASDWRGRVLAWAQAQSTWFWVSTVLALCAVPGIAMPALLGALGFGSLFAPARLEVPATAKRVPATRVGRAPQARRTVERRAVSPDSLRVRPLQDVVLRGDALAKQRSALYLSTALEQAPAPLLDVLLADPDLDVRSAAAVAVSRLEMANSRLLQDAGQDAAASPEDPQVYLRLAETYRSYAFNAVTSETQQSFLLARALAALQDGLARVPDHPDLLLCAADTAWVSGDAAAARGYVQAVLQQPEYPPAALALLADIALNTHDYSLLREAEHASNEAEADRAS